MTQVNMLEEKANLPMLVNLLESRQEETILIARNGIPVAEMRLVQRPPASKRIGAAKGEFHVPDDFDEWDDILDAFEEEL